MGADVVVPFLAGDVLLGWLALRDQDDVAAFGEAELRRLSVAAERAAAVLETLQGWEKLKEEHRLAALGTMAAGLAHEIRNPLAGIKGAAQYLQGGVTGPDAEMVGVIVDEVDRLDRVVTQFLDYARPLRLSLEPIDARRLVQRVLTLVEAQGSAGAVTVVEEHDEDQPHVPCDPTRMQQVLLNLCLNGIQAMKRGGRLVVRTRRGHLRDPRARNAPALEIAVTDTGVGIAQDDIDKLFVPFWTTRHEGTGLGLAISRRVVLAHGGELDVRSAVGTGSTFTVRLPLPAGVPDTGAA
jgi:signal transduction histidine kinase